MSKHTQRLIWRLNSLVSRYTAKILKRCDRFMKSHFASRNKWIDRTTLAALQLWMSIATSIESSRKAYRSVRERSVDIQWKSKQCYYSSKGQDDQDDSGDFGVAVRNLSRHRMTIADIAESFIRLTLLIGGTWYAYSSRTGRCKSDKRNEEYDFNSSYKCFAIYYGYMITKFTSKWNISVKGRVKRWYLSTFS